MRAINHAVTGAVIAVASGNAWLAVPAAIASHFVLDAIPHHGDAHKVPDSQSFTNTLIADALLCIGLVAVLSVWQPSHWQLASVCAFLATSPDLMWIGRFRNARRGLKPPRFNTIMRFHSQIQWFQRPIGVVTEVAWFIGMSWILYGIGR